MDTLGIVKVIWPWITPGIAALGWLLRIEFTAKQNKVEVEKLTDKVDVMFAKLDSMATDMAVIKQKLGVITGIVSPDKLTAHTERTATLMAEVRHLRKELDARK